MHYVQTHGGSRSEAIDIFHDGIIALDRNIRAGAYQPTSSLQGYLYSICRFCWNNEYRRRKKVRPTAIEDFQMAPDAITPEITLRAKEETELLEQVLALLDTSCRKIMTLWKLSYSMAEIASEMNLSSPELAKKYRYRCMQKLMDNLQHHPHLLNALKNG